MAKTVGLTFKPTKKPKGEKPGETKKPEGEKPDAKR